MRSILAKVNYRLFFWVLFLECVPDDDFFDTSRRDFLDIDQLLFHSASCDCDHVWQLCGGQRLNRLSIFEKAINVR